jgi:hypothetical protein
MSNNKINSIIEIRISELELLLKTGKYQEAETLIPNITKFISILTEEQVDLVNAAKYAVSENIPWK